MAKYRIIYDREACIGVIACVSVNPAFWEVGPDGKADLKGSKLRKDGKYELIVDEKDYPLNKDAAEVCPVLAIVIEKA